MSSATILVRAYQDTDAPNLRDVFLSAVHGTASHYYSPPQIEAWASRLHDAAAWQQKMAALNPFVAELNGNIAGYADLQADGLIDHFFVAAETSRRGVGRTLMQALVETARLRQIRDLQAYVSLAAEAFFETNGFQVVRRQTVVVRGVTLDNALMARSLTIP